MHVTVYCDSDKVTRADTSSPDSTYTCVILPRVPAYSTHKSSLGRARGGGTQRPHLPRLLRKAAEGTSGLIQERAGTVVLDDRAGIKDQNSLVEGNCVEAVRHGEDRRRAAEVLADHRLDPGVSLVVHVRGGLVHDEDGRRLEQRTCHADELPLPRRQVRAALRHLGVQPSRQGANLGFEPRAAQRVPQPRVAAAAIADWIEVVPHRPSEERGLLLDDGEARAHRLQSDRLVVGAADADGACRELHHAEERDRERTLACASPTDDAAARPRRHREGEARKDRRRGGGVLQADILEADGPVARPLWRRRLTLLVSLGLEPGELVDALDVVHRHLQLRVDAEKPHDGLRKLRRVGKSQPGVATLKLIGLPQHASNHCTRHHRADKVHRDP
mmetsp:Transcript_3201/g.9811  ORF Transcript_3201/g.9811 Transcript_3201/m.9811 type:complete len:388 (-) Transcript_3201:3736-4899(-)